MRGHLLGNFNKVEGERRCLSEKAKDKHEDSGARVSATEGSLASRGLMGGWGGQGQYPGSLSLPHAAASGVWALAAQAGNILKGKKDRSPLRPGSWAGKLANRSLVGLGAGPN